MRGLRAAFEGEICADDGKPARTIRFSGETGQVFLPQVPEWAMRQNEMMNQPGAQSDFDALDGIQENDAQPAVEIVATPDCVERRAGSECVQPLALGIHQAKWMEIALKSVVVDRSEASYQCFSIRRKSALEEQIRLLFQGEVRCARFLDQLP